MSAEVVLLILAAFVAGCVVGGVYAYRVTLRAAEEWIAEHSASRRISTE